jgi:hypothetical protein
MTAHGLIDAMKTVFTVYGGSVAADGTVVLTGAGQLLGWASALVFIWVLLATVVAACTVFHLASRRSG